MNANTRIAVAHYDSACVPAIREGVSISELMRREFTRVLDDESDGED